jgi:hypothetical protein
MKDGDPCIFNPYKMADVQTSEVDANEERGTMKG